MQHPAPVNAGQMPQKQSCDTLSGQGGLSGGQQRENLDPTMKHRLWLQVTEPGDFAQGHGAHTGQLAPEILTNITAPGPTYGCLTEKDTQLGPKYINIPWENGNFLAAF